MLAALIALFALAVSIMRKQDMRNAEVRLPKIATPRPPPMLCHCKHHHLIFSKPPYQTDRRYHRPPQPPPPLEVPLQPCALAHQPRRRERPPAFLLVLIGKTPNKKGHHRKVMPLKSFVFVLLLYYLPPLALLL